MHRPALPLHPVRWDQLAAERLLGLALNSAPNTRAVPELCKRVRFRKSTCRTCSDICPEHAISLNPGPTISGSCSDCGLCEIACPTEALRNELRTDRQLLAEARSLLLSEPAGGRAKVLSVGCHRAQLEKARGIRVPCVGSVSENILLGAALLGFDEVVLIKGRCAECRWKQGEEILAHSIHRSKALLEMGGLNRVSVRIEDTERSSHDALPRRELFTSIGRSLRKHMVVILHHEEKAIREAVGTASASEACAAPRREHLSTLLRQGPLDGSAAPHEEWFPWARVVIDEWRCCACGICTHLCPTAAISQERQTGCEVIGFRCSLCTNCGLCQEACPEGAIRFQEKISLADAVDDERHVLALVGTSDCCACGDTIPAGRKKLCATCEKRQSWLTQPAVR